MLIYRSLVVTLELEPLSSLYKVNKQNYARKCDLLPSSPLLPPLSSYRSHCYYLQRHKRRDYSRWMACCVAWVGTLSEWGFQHLKCSDFRGDRIRALHGLSFG